MFEFGVWMNSVLMHQATDGGCDLLRKLCVMFLNREIKVLLFQEGSCTKKKKKFSFYLIDCMAYRS